MKKFLALIVSLFSLGAAAQTPSFTPNIGLQIPAFGQQNWHIPMNYNFTLLDRLLSGNAALPALSITGQANFPQLTTWQSTTSYSTGTVVAYLGGFYASLSSGNEGNLPTNATFWTTNLAGAVSTFGALQAGIVPASGGGTTNYLRADGSWSAPSGGMTLISSQTLASPASSVTFSSIPGTYTKLVLVDNATSASLGTYQLTLNADGAAHYNDGYILNTTGTITGSYNATDVFGNIGTVSTAAGAHEISIGFYTSGLPKIWTATSLSVGSSWLQQNTTGVWSGTATITSITLSVAGSVNLSTGSSFRLYGSP